MQLVTPHERELAARLESTVCVRASHVALEQSRQLRDLETLHSAKSSTTPPDLIRSIHDRAIAAGKSLLST